MILVAVTERFNSSWVRLEGGLLPMGRIEKGAICSVSGCTEKAVRSVSAARAESVKLNVGDSRHVYLCEAHYREFKKRSRKDQRPERMRWSVQT